MSVAHVSQVRKALYYHCESLIVTSLSATLAKRRPKYSNKQLSNDAATTIGCHQKQSRL